MAGQNLEWKIGSAFALGVLVGVFLKSYAKQIQERVQTGMWHREYERTVAYDEHLPDTLERREPAPHEGQPRYGGTGALGVSPATVATKHPGGTTTGAGPKA
jgi:hypothetical protein